MSLRQSLRVLVVVPTLAVLAACAGDGPTAPRITATPSFRGGEGSSGGSATPAPAVADINGSWVALTVDPTDSRYDQRLSLRVDQRGTALSGQYESVYVCCAESNNKYKFTGTIDAAGNVTLLINAGAGDHTVTFRGTVAADRRSLTGTISNGSGSSAPITFTR